MFSLRMVLLAALAAAFIAAPPLGAPEAPEAPVAAYAQPIAG